MWKLKIKKVAHNDKSVFLSFFLFGRKTDIHTKDYKVVQQKQFIKTSLDTK